MTKVQKKLILRKRANKLKKEKLNEKNNDAETQVI